MGMRLGLGPVFACETLLNARRRQVYAGRSLFVAALLAGLAVVWLREDAPQPGGATIARMAEIGTDFFYAMAGIQVALVMLVAPAVAAGSICMDRARGTLAHLLVTDLSAAEIALGKLAARAAPVVGMIACAVPVTAVAMLLGGIDVAAVAGAFVVSAALAVLGCALAVAISAGARKTHEVLLAVYTVEGLWLLALPMWRGWAARGFVAPPKWFERANPLALVFAPYETPGSVGWIDFAAFVGAALAVSAALAALTIATLRRSVVAESGRAARAPRPIRSAPRRRFPTLAGPTLDGNPVLWREWHRNRPSRFARWLGGSVMLATWAAAAWGGYEIITMGLDNAPRTLPLAFMLHLLFGMLMLSASAPTALAEERVRGSLDVLLATPLSTAEIVAGKWWGMYRRVFVLAALPLFVSALYALWSPDVPPWAGRVPTAQQTVPLVGWDRVLSVVHCVTDVLASGAILVSLGLVIATLVPRLGRAVAVSVALYFLMAIGLFVLGVMLSEWMAQSRGYESYQDRRWLFHCVVALSPIGGPMTALSALESFWDRPRTTIWVSLGSVTLLKWAVAGLLFWWTVRTFDRRMGRVPETGGDRGMGARNWGSRRRAGASMLGGLLGTASGKEARDAHPDGHVVPDPRGV